MAPDLLGLPPEQVLMVAAHANDLRAAAAAGLRTAYVHRPLEFGPERAPERADRAAFDLTARDFEDLAEQLGA